MAVIRACCAVAVFIMPATWEAYSALWDDWRSRSSSTSFLAAASSLFNDVTRTRSAMSSLLGPRGAADVLFVVVLLPLPNLDTVTTSSSTYGYGCSVDRV